MSKKREIRVAYAAERQELGPTKWGCLPLLIFFWVFHIILLSGELIVYVIKAVTSKLWDKILRFLLRTAIRTISWPPIAGVLAYSPRISFTFWRLYLTYWEVDPP
jgi:hypothetical protein